MHYLTDYHDMPFTDAYYALEEALATDGWQVTKHMEGDHAVYVVKDKDAIGERLDTPAADVQPPAARERTSPVSTFRTPTTLRRDARHHA